MDIKRDKGKKQLLLKCGQCDYTSKFKHNLQKHIWIHTGEKPFYCPFCEKLFRQGQTAQGHVKALHGQTLPLSALKIKPKQEVDDENSSSSRDTANSVPAKIKSLECLDCGTILTTRSSTLEHFNVHIAEKYKECTMCKQVFLSQPALTKHIRETHKIEKELQCSVCSKTFASSEKLKRHIFKLHKDETVQVPNMPGGSGKLIISNLI